MTKEAVSIPCGRITLEGIVRTPDNAAKAMPGAVICHPHPLFGGNMFNNVTQAMSSALLDRGMVTLLFNFRGTGGSGGVHGGGITETEDVVAALDFLAARPDVDLSKLLVVGYSFGCWVGLKAANQDPRPWAMIGISPPADMYDFSFLKEEKRPKLLLGGDMDFVCSKSSFLNLIREIPEPKRAMVLPNTDHFHFGRENQLIVHVGAFLNDLLL
jgi:uncharacterized protein